MGVAISGMDRVAFFILSLLLCPFKLSIVDCQLLPAVINTWPFVNANYKGKTQLFHACRAVVPNNIRSTACSPVGCLHYAGTSSMLIAFAFRSCGGCERRWLLLGCSRGGVFWVWDWTVWWVCWIWWKVNITQCFSRPSMWGSYCVLHSPNEQGETTLDAMIMDGWVYTCSCNYSYLFLMLLWLLSQNVSWCGVCWVPKGHQTGHFSGS